MFFKGPQVLTSSSFQLHFGKRGIKTSEYRKHEERPKENTHEGGLDKLNLRENMRETGVNLRKIIKVCGRLSASA